MRYIYSLLLISVTLFAYVDSDMDGVEDALDRCPGTPITDLVDAKGCSKQSLVDNNHYDIIVGVGIGQTNYALTPNTDTYTSILQADYYYKDFALQASTSFYDTTSRGYSDSGMNDSVIAASYILHPSSDVGVRVGAGVILPTYDSDLNNNETDYIASLNVSRSIGDANIFAGYSYTIINDKDVVNATDTVYYQNTNAYTVGAGYNFTPKLYANLSYFQANSIYKGVQDLKSVSAYMFYSIDDNWFFNLSYSRGLSDSTSDSYGYVSLGYYF